jgi:antitoxin (DNA-binding transcriptional repressor) of toxin-antitoxin stability system
MKSFGIRQAKAHLSELARAAAAGESTLITDYRKPIAMISPLVEETMHAEAPATPIEEPKPSTDAAAFRRALFEAPHALELDF